MSISNIWWAADCPKCGGRRLLDARKSDEKRFEAMAAAECVNCHTEFSLAQVLVYLYDRSTGERVARH